MNGVLDTSATTTVSVSLSPKNFALGFDFRDKIYYLQGTLDNMYMYNYVLTLAEIQSLYRMVYESSIKLSTVQFLGTLSTNIENYRDPLQYTSIMAGTGTNAYNGDNIVATSTNLFRPRGIWVDSVGNLYIADSDHHLIRKIAAFSNIISTIAGKSEVFGLAGDGKQASSALFYFPDHLWISSTGNIFIADNKNHRIRSISTAGIVATVAGYGAYGYNAGCSGDNGPATSATLGQGYGMIGDTAGNIYLSDVDCQKVRVISITGIVTTFAGTGTSGYTAAHDGNAATSATLTNPHGLAIDSNSNVFIADKGAYRIRKVASATKFISTFVGTGVSTFADGPASSASIVLCESLWVDSVGNLIFTDRSGSRIRKVDINNIVSTIAGNGIVSAISDNQAATSGIGYPARFWGDTSGNLYFYDYYVNGMFKLSSTTNTIVKFTKAGSQCCDYTVGVASTATQVSDVCGIFIDTSGNLFAGSFNQNRVMKINIFNSNSLSSTYAGSYNPKSFIVGDNVPATSALFGGVGCLWGDSNGNLYIYDRSNYRIRKIDSSGIKSTIMGGTREYGYSGYGGDGGMATEAYLSYPWHSIGDTN